MATVTVTVCDRCGQQGDTERYEIKKGARKAQVDLCADDSTALEGLLDEFPAAPVRQRQTRQRERKVVTIEEIEAMKKKR